MKTLTLLALLLSVAAPAFAEEAPSRTLHAGEAPRRPDPCRRGVPRPMGRGESPARQGTEAPNALRNGGFELDQDGDGAPDGWTLRGLAGRVDQRPGDGAWAVSLAGSSTSPDAAITQRVAVPSPAPTVATIACLLRSSELAPAGTGQAAAELTVGYLDAKGQPVRKPKSIVTWTKPVGWRPWTGLVRIPAGTAALEVTLSLTGAEGQVMFDDVRLFWALPDDLDRANWLVDGGFEYHGLWSPWTFDPGQKVHYPGRRGHGLLRLALKPGDGEEAAASDGRARATQAFALGPDAAGGVARLGAAVRSDQVRPESPDGGGWLTLEWRDADDAVIGEPVRLGPWAAGPMAAQDQWLAVRHETAVPAGARRGVVCLELERAMGILLIDDVRLEIDDAQGQPLLRPAASRTTVEAWAPFAPSDGPLTGALDASDLLDPPAGRHGFLRVDEGRFAFEDGAPARFFGVNLDGAVAFGAHEEAEALARRLAQLGCNIVRLHHLDAKNVQPNIFDPSRDDTQRLAPEALDRLDYLIAQLKRRGIYVYLDLLVSRSYKAGDDVPAYTQLSKGGKMAAVFHPRLIALQQAYARALLTHRNPYTKARWVEEPAIALIDIVNENSMGRFPKRAKALPEPYQQALREQWAQWLAAQGLDAPPQIDPIDTPGAPQVQRFYADVQLRYLLSMRTFLRALGVRTPIAGSNLGAADPSGLDLATNSRMDFVDGHAYWDPPRSGVGDLTKFHNRPFVVEPDEDHPIARLARLRTAGKPLVVSEWNIDWPNESRAMGPLLMAAYGSLQEWSGLLQFNFDGPRAPEQITSNFDVSGKPELLWQLPIAARLFHRGDVAPATQRVAYPMTPQPAIPPALALVHGVWRSVGVDQAPAAEPGGAPWQSDTGQLVWDAQRAVALIRTPATQAVIGNAGGRPVDLPDARVELSTPFAVVAMTSLDNRPLAGAHRVLVVAVARSENRGTVYTATRTMLRDSGQPPILLEPVEGWLAVPQGERPAPVVYGLDGRGRRVRELPVSVKDRVARIPLGGSHLYEIVFGKP